VPNQIDPYVYPGTSVLKNRFGITDPRKLEIVEYSVTWPRRQELEKQPVTGNFDLPHLQEIHRRLFQDLFSWAGDLRTVVITKGASTFFASSNWNVAAEHTFGYLHQSPLLKPGASEISDREFVEHISELLSRINYLHPFRDGNGRAQRAFLDQVATLGNRTLSWRNVGRMENVRASIESMATGNGKPFEPLIAAVLAPPLDGLSPFDDDVYQVSGQLEL